MRKRSLPIMALLMGAAGFILRRRELIEAFDPGTGLASFTSPFTWALIALSAVLLLTLLLGTRPVTPSFSAGYGQAFAAPHVFYLFMALLAAVLVLAGGALRVRDYLAANDPVILQLILALSALPACVGMGVIAWRNYCAKGTGKFSLPLLIPAYFCCVWLITAYQAHSANPVHLSYVYQTFAVICAVLALYFMAGFSFEQNKTRRFLVAALMCVYFCIVSLADFLAGSLTLSDTLLFAALPLYLLPQTAALLRNAARPDSITEEIADE